MRGKGRPRRQFFPVRHCLHFPTSYGHGKKTKEKKTSTQGKRRKRGRKIFAFSLAFPNNHGRKEGGEQKLTIFSRFSFFPPFPFSPLISSGHAKAKGGGGRRGEKKIEKQVGYGRRDERHSQKQADGRRGWHRNLTSLNLFFKK